MWATSGFHDASGLAEIELARQCDPLSVPVNATISYVWSEARHPEFAVGAALKAL
jgi:hypothetical protein